MLRYIKDCGTAILISNTPEGQVAHYLYGKFGGHYEETGRALESEEHPWVN
ncbi:MAG: hypothetical protein QXF26_06290 [Candidatus Bathyarchaeia archaeon]